jgi:hypothetical protein
MKTVLYHRPLSTYFKAFRSVGFQIEDFDEPNLVHGSIPNYTPEKEMNSQLLPLVASFLLQKQ